MSRVTRGTPSGDAYLDLQNQARRQGRPTQELLQLYVLEAFLFRLAESDLRDSFVLKGGVLLAAFDARRPTKDVDLAGIDVTNDVSKVLDLIRRVLRVIPRDDDGVTFDSGSATAETIREGDDYSGVRVHVEALLASAKLSFHVDLNVGDPIWPSPETTALPRLRGGALIELPGYPIHMVHAEKIVTAVQRGTANTRWRDFGDVWSLSRRYPISGDNLTRAVDEVARHRRVPVVPLSDVLAGFDQIGQVRWAQWRRRSNSDHLPKRFAAVLDQVIAFADPALGGNAAGKSWDPGSGMWS